MYTVKKLNKGEVYKEIKLSDTKTVVWRARGERFAIIDEQGNVVFTPNPITGKLQAEVFERKYAAQEEADWLNNENGGGC